MFDTQDELAIEHTTGFISLKPLFEPFLDLLMQHGEGQNGAR